MSRDEEDKSKALCRRPASPEYEVGYAKPPVSARFKPGQSGNPSGRPRGSKNRPKPPALNEERLKSIILEEAYRTVSVNDVKGPMVIPMAQAVIRSLAVNAAKGNQRAQRLFTELLSSVETANRRLNDEWLDMAITYKVEWERELERRARLKITGSEPLPHPDHVIIDLRKGTAYIRGPATKEQKQQWDLWHEQRRLLEEELEELRALQTAPTHADQAGLSEEIAKTEKVLQIVELALASGSIPEEFPRLNPAEAVSSSTEHPKR